MFTRATMVVSSLPPETCSRNFNHCQIYRVSMPALVGGTRPKRREAWHPVVFFVHASVTQTDLFGKCQGGQVKSSQTKKGLPKTGKPLSY